MKTWIACLALLHLGGTALAQGNAAPAAAATTPSFDQVLAELGTEAGLEFRYGPAATDPPAKAPTYAQRPSKSFTPISKQLPDGGDRACSPNGWCGEWQLGGPLSKDGGDFSSSILNIVFLPDAQPGAGFYPKRYFGVASLQQISVNNNAMAVKPEVSWTTFDGKAFNGGDNDYNIERYAGLRETDPWWPKGVVLDRPVALGKCWGRGGWCNNSLVAFASGWIVSIGSNTSHNPMAVKLPDGMVPTAIAVTNSGEFALVSVMNRNTRRAQVAVIALGDGCQYCDPNNEKGWNANWGSARRIYMGMPGLGNYLAGKYLGAVDLPDSLRLPTDIAVTTGRSPEMYERIRNFWNDGIESTLNRQRYRDDPWWTQAIARTGMAVVISKAEKRAVFLDLRPLFAYYRKTYLTDSQLAFDDLVANRGPRPDQWPYSFDKVAEQRPRVIREIALPQPPTAVRMTLNEPHRALIATQEGSLRVFDLGTRYLDQKGEARGRPEDIVQRFALAVGRNPTSIAPVRDHGDRVYGKDAVTQFFILAARQDRSIQWVRFSRDFSSASIFKSLRDSRIVDPVAVEDSANHGTESYVVSIADYASRSVRNYLYGPVIFWTYPAGSGCPKPQGCSLLGGQPFEYGGSHELPGRPFQLGGSNIN